MAKKIREKKEKSNYSFPSRFGSHLSMVDEELTKKLDDVNKVVCNDEHGSYVTFRNRLDSGVSDPARYETKRVEYLCRKNSELDK